MHMLCDVSVADNFWKHCGERKYYSWWAISLFCHNIFNSFKNILQFMVKFRIHVFKIANVCWNRLTIFPHAYALWRLCSKWLMKTLWQKEIFLIMSLNINHMLESLNSMEMGGTKGSRHCHRSSKRNTWGNDIPQSTGGLNWQ